MKRQQQKIVALTAYDYTFARMVDAAGIDLILVGDSLGMVVQGRANTLPVTMDEMHYHTAMVARAARRALVVGDMPFISYQVGPSIGLLLCNCTSSWGNPPSSWPRPAGNSTTKRSTRCMRCWLLRLRGVNPATADLRSCVFPAVPMRGWHWPGRWLPRRRSRRYPRGGTPPQNSVRPPQ